MERRADLSYAEFVQQYAFSRPVILQRLTDNSVSAAPRPASPPAPARP